MFIFGFLFVGTPASAAQSVDCGDGHKIWSADSTVVVSCIARVDWEKAMSGSRNLTQNDDTNLVKVSRGRGLLTIFGEDTCPTWFPMNCVIKKALFVKFL